MDWTFSTIDTIASIAIAAATIWYVWSALRPDGRLIINTKGSSNMMDKGWMLIFKLMCILTALVALYGLLYWSKLWYTALATAILPVLFAIIRTWWWNRQVERAFNAMMER